MKYLVLLMALAACNSLPVSTRDYEAELAFQRISSEKTLSPQRQEEEWKKFLSQYPTSAYTASAYFQRAANQEKLKEFSTAISYYKSAITAWGSRQPKDQIQAELRIAYCHHYLGQTSLLVASLSQIEKKRSHLSMEQQQIEIPALYALAYAKENNFNAAEKYLAQADKNIQIFFRKKVERPSWVAEILSNMAAAPMANIEITDEETLAQFLREEKIRYSYFVRLLELQIEPYASQALAALKQQTTKSRERINRPLVGDLLERREQALLQRDRMQKWMSLLDEVKASFLPDFQVSAAFTEIQQIWDELNRENFALLSRKIPGDGLSPEALKRQGLYKEGTLKPVESPSRTKDPNL